MVLVYYYFILLQKIFLKKIKLAKLFTASSEFGISVKKKKIHNDLFRIADVKQGNATKF